MIIIIIIIIIIKNLYCSLCKAPIILVTLNKLEYPRQILEKYSTKFYENLFIIIIIIIIIIIKSLCCSLCKVPIILVTLNKL